MTKQYQNGIKMPALEARAISPDSSSLPYETGVARR
jgi:hypothetical protein